MLLVAILMKRVKGVVTEKKKLKNRDETKLLVRSEMFRLSGVCGKHLICWSAIRYFATSVKIFIECEVEKIKL